MENKCLLLPILILLSGCGNNVSSSDESISQEIQLSSTSVIEESSEISTKTLADYIIKMEANTKNYKEEVASKGTIEDFNYTYNSNNKVAKVYLPYGYNDGNDYDVLYLLHSFNGNENTYIDKISIGKVLDNLIASNEIKPLIVVMPTWNVDGVSPAENDIYKEFPTELVSIVEEVEKTYKTYSKEDKRNHRICGGYSMGGITTWSVFVHYFDMFYNYINMSGYMWEISKQKDDIFQKKNLALLEKARNEATYKDYKLYNYVGGQDFVHDYLLAQLEKMNTSELFDFEHDITIKVMDEYTHDTKYSDLYLIDALKTIYRNK